MPDLSAPMQPFAAALAVSFTRQTTANPACPGIAKHAVGSDFDNSGRSRHDCDLGIAGKSADGEAKARRRTVDSRVDLHAEQFCGAVHVGGDLDAADDAAGHALAVAADRVPAAQALWGVIEITQGEVGAWQDLAFLLAYMYHGADNVAVQPGLQILNPKPCKKQIRRLLLMHQEGLATTKQKK